MLHDGLEREEELHVAQAVGEDARHEEEVYDQDRDVREVADADAAEHYRYEEGAEAAGRLGLHARGDHHAPAAGQRDHDGEEERLEEGAEDAPRVGDPRRPRAAGAGDGPGHRCEEGVGEAHGGAGEEHKMDDGDGVMIMREEEVEDKEIGGVCEGQEAPEYGGDGVDGGELNVADGEMLVAGVEEGGASGPGYTRLVGKESPVEVGVVDLVGGVGLEGVAVGLQSVTVEEGVGGYLGVLVGGTNVTLDNAILRLETVAELDLDGTPDSIAEGTEELVVGFAGDFDVRNDP